MPLTLAWTPTPAGANRDGRSRNEMSTHDPISAWRDTAGPTKAPTATPIPSISLQRFQLRSNSRKNVLDMPLTLAWTTTPAGAKTETAGAGTKCPRMTRSLLGVTLPGLQRHQQQRLYQASIAEQQQEECPRHAADAGLDDDSRWGQNRDGRSRNEMSTHDPISAWRDTAGPTKAPNSNAYTKHLSNNDFK